MSVLLEGLSERDRDPVAAGLAQCAVVSLPQGSTRFASRLPASSLLVVEEGIVMVSRLAGAASRQLVLALRARGGIVMPLGEDECLQAITDAWLTAVTPGALAALLAVPAAAAALVDRLVQTVKCSSESLRQFARVRAADRLREKLLQLARDHGHVVRGGIRLDLPLTHELLAEMIGASRETVTWAFAELTREGFVAREGRAYRLAVSPEQLVS